VNWTPDSPLASVLELFAIEHPEHAEMDSKEAMTTFSTWEKQNPIAQALIREDNAARSRSTQKEAKRKKGAKLT
jgi:hypothetical protein